MLWCLWTLLEHVIMFLMISASYIVPFIALYYVLQVDLTWAWVSLPAMFFLTLFMFVTFSVVLKWVLVGRLQPVTIQKFSFQWLKMHFCDRFQGVVLDLLQYYKGTFLLNAYHRMLGSTIGSDTYLDSKFINGYELLSVGDGVTVQHDAFLLAGPFVR